MPDYPSLLQAYIWQEYDVFPQLPKLRTFLVFWNKELEGKLFKVRVAHSRFLKPAEVTLIGAELTTH